MNHCCHLFNEGEQRFTVALPLFRKFTLVRKLVTAQEDGELKTVGVQVAEVIHTCTERGYKYTQDSFWLGYLAFSF